MLSGLTEKDIGRAASTPSASIGVIRTTFQIIRPVLDEVGRFLLIKSVIRKNPAEYFIPFVCRNKETLFGLKRLLFHKSFIEQI